MAKRDQLEIISPGGQVTFVDLSPSRGITNIGRHPDNDIVLEGPEVALFHAMLDHRQKPYQFMLISQQGMARLGGEVLLPNVSRELSNWDAVELNGHSLILLEDVTAPDQPAPARLPRPAAPAALPPGTAGSTLPAPRPAAAPAAVLPDHVDEVLVAEISGREFTVNVEERATLELSLVNGGDIVATFHVDVRGLDHRWVTVSPPQVNLYEGERATVSITLRAPRLPSSRAGAHRFAVVVTSPNHPTRSSTLSATLFIQPYHAFEVDDLSPKQQTLRWRRQAGRAGFAVANRGNSETPFHLDAADDERGCRFEFQLAGEDAGLTRQVELRLAPDESRTVGLQITPLRRRLVGLRNHTYAYTVTATPLAGQLTPRSILGQLTSTPIIGTWLVVLAAALLAALLAFIFRPTIAEFQAEPRFIDAGQATVLRWRASPFSGLRVDPDIGALPGAAGELTITPKPLNPQDPTVVYTLRAENILSRLLPALFAASRDVEVVVGPVRPQAQLDADRTSVITGDSVTLSWTVTAAEEVILTTNGVAETIPPNQYRGSRVVTPDSGETVYVLIAKNRYRPDGVKVPVTVRATPPTATPLPPPVIQRFEALPISITAGEKVTLQWSVSGVDKVTISPLGGDYPPNGSVAVSPDTTTPYVLTASNGQKELTSLQEVIVSPAPTPTPVPGTPKIEFFTVSPVDVVLGNAGGGSIVLAWSVTGDTTNIEISSLDFGRFSALDRQGTLTLTVDKSSQFVLTANNGSLSASQTVQINASVPVPSISGFAIPGVTRRYAFAGGPAFTLTVNGANFVSSSVVRWNGVDHPTTYVSATQLNADISASDIAAVGQFPVTVFNPAPGGGTSAPLNFAVNNPTPMVDAAGLAPSTTTVGTNRVTLTVNGASFINASVVRWNGTDRTTTFVSSTQLRIDLTAADLAVVGLYPVTVYNPPPLGGISSPVYFAVGNPTPGILSLSPSSVPVTLSGTASTVITINGTNFMPTSTVAWKGQLLASTLVSPTRMTAVLPYTLTSPADSGPFTVSNPGPGGGTSNPEPFTITKRSTSVNLTSSASSTVYGQAVSFTAAVSGSGGTPDGSVVFRLNGVDQATVNLNAGQASFSPSPPLVANALGHVVDATYGGDANFEVSASNTVTQVVTRAATTVSITQLPAAPIYGQQVDFTARVTASAPGAGTPTGILTFTVDGVPQTPLNLNGGQATFSTSSLWLGPHSLSVNYAGDPNFAPGGPGLSNPTINPVPTLVNVSGPGVIPVYGQPVAFTATVTSGAGMVTGTVTFLADGVPFSSAIPLTAGQAVSPLIANLPAGTRSIRADYTPAAGAIFAANGTTHPQVINTVGTSTAITYDVFPNPSSATITVTPNAPGTLFPAGLFVDYCPYILFPSYYYGCNRLTLNAGGQATFSFGGIGTPLIAEAYFDGNANFGFSYARNP